MDFGQRVADLEAMIESHARGREERRKRNEARAAELAKKPGGKVVGSAKRIVGEKASAEAAAAQLTSTDCLCCSNCGTELRNGARFCSNCGSQVASRDTVASVTDSPAFCPGCGKKLRGGEKFCGNCGEKIL